MDFVFRHEAVFYAGPEAFLDRVAPFVEEGVAAGEPVMVALEAPKLRALSERLGAAAERVELVDMGDVGHNPACIIPAWRDFVGRPLRRRRCAASASRSGPAAAPPSSSSASATRRCSTTPSPIPTASTWSAPTTSRTSTAT